MTAGRAFDLDHRVRAAVIGTLALLVALIATAFAIGGSGSPSNESAGGASASAAIAKAPAGTTNGVGVAGGVGAAPLLAAHRSATTFSADSAASGAGSTAAGTPAEQPPEVSASESSSGDSLGATKIVKTGELTLRVDASQVQTAVRDLTALATAQGGYVASSNTNTGGGEPSGEVVLRVPVGHFADAVSAAEKVAGGHVLSLTTSADDVTGHYVDLAARRHALEQTRATYLTILGHATTIGATLAVQDRIQTVQEQIDQLTGQLKLLGSQASYSTLTVDVTPVALVAAASHQPHGLSKAWHTSWSRFGRGMDSIVAAIGPIVLALLILAVALAVSVAGYRGMRRVAS
ncbi:MAG TPA: DUF4349 domain-containing protein [Mycobacteriales bacterium]|nr:DUF4349 domain-containing protein [Mycobacteriales bacterium]